MRTLSVFALSQDWAVRWGLWRSIIMYYGWPGRRRRMVEFYAQFIKPNTLAFDIGSHVGNRLQAWLDLGANVVAVEPQPACLALLRKWYGSRTEAVLLGMAVGAYKGTQNLYISRRTPTVSTLSIEWQENMQKIDSFAGVRWDSSTQVEVTTLDDLIGQFGLPAFCKIDVEGYEHEVLCGLSQPIASLSFEYVPAALITSIACVERISELGNYRFNWSPGERLQLQERQWLTSAEIAEVLHGMHGNANSGDVYARLDEMNLNLT